MPNIVLSRSGESHQICKSNKDLSVHQSNLIKIKAVLQWSFAVDLDIHAFYRDRNTGKDGHVNYFQKGSKDKTPFIHLNKDMGVGNIAGNNEEIITVTSMRDISHLLIATNIFRFFEAFSMDDNFSRYDGKVILNIHGSDNIEVPLTDSSLGRWCSIALIDNSDPYQPIVTNINKVTKSEPVLADYIQDDVVDMQYK